MKLHNVKCTSLETIAMKEPQFQTDCLEILFFHFINNHNDNEGS